MKVVIQRVQNASLKIDGRNVGETGAGMVILLGVHIHDEIQDLEWLFSKVKGLRIFSDDEGKMNLDLIQANSEIMIISQFTLFASTKKGNRPSFLEAAKPEKALYYFNLFIDKFEKETKQKIVKGVFGSDMKINLTNDGPVTIVIDSKNKE